jgi:excisionase family DNA binding protein
VSDQTVRRLIDSGELPAFRIRGVVRVTAEALDAFVARSST